MADRFETRLERMFADPPPLADADAFAGRVQGRLGTGQRVRNLLIVLAGAVGGVVAVGQAVDANLGAAVMGADRELAPVNAALAQPLQDERLTDLTSQLMSFLPNTAIGTEVTWTVAALAIAGLAFLGTRIMGEV